MKDNKINLVVLDGTYSHARRQLRHLEAMIRQFNDDNMGVPISLPVVKLKMGEEGKSIVLFVTMNEKNLTLLLIDSSIRCCISYNGNNETAFLGQDLFFSGINKCC